MKPITKVLRNLSTVRGLRADLLDAAYEFAASRRPTTLIILGGKLSPSRIKEEMDRLSVISPAAAESISVQIYNPDTHPLSTSFPDSFRDVSTDTTLSVSFRRGSRYDVYAVLLLAWFNGEAPMTVKSLCETSGTSYPTAAAVIKQLSQQNLLRVWGDRRVSLVRFPSDLWRQWVATRFAHRKAARFVDRSGQSRSPASLIKRLARLGRDDIAVAGIEGARYHYRDLDLTGAMHLNLVLHGPHTADLDFVSRLDPALEPTDNPFEDVDLIVHFVNRPVAGFTMSEDFPVADPLECISDLYEMNLGYQADEMLSYLKGKAKHA